MVVLKGEDYESLTALALAAIVEITRQHDAGSHASQCACLESIKAMLRQLHPEVYLRDSDGTYHRDGDDADAWKGRGPNPPPIVMRELGSPHIDSLVDSMQLNADSFLASLAREDIGAAHTSWHRLRLLEHWLDSLGDATAVGALNALKSSVDATKTAFRTRNQLSIARTVEDLYQAVMALR